MQVKQESTLTLRPSPSFQAPENQVTYLHCKCKMYYKGGNVLKQSSNHSRCMHYGMYNHLALLLFYSFCFVNLFTSFVQDVASTSGASRSASTSFMSSSSITMAGNTSMYHVQVIIYALMNANTVLLLFILIYHP